MSQLQNANCALLMTKTHALVSQRTAFSVQDVMPTLRLKVTEIIILPTGNCINLVAQSRPLGFRLPDVLKIIFRAPPKSSGEAGSSSPRKGKKRALEDAELPPGDPDTREFNRPRTENYVPPQQESPSVFGWFLTPFKAFVSGFKDSLS